MVGRPGLDPGTLRPENGRSQASVSIHLSFSKDVESSQTSAKVSVNLLLRLHNWLHELDFNLVGVMRGEDSNRNPSGRITEMAIDTQRR